MIHSALLKHEKKKSNYKQYRAIFRGNVKEEAKKKKKSK